mgnify:FL=1
MLPGSWAINSGFWDIKTGCCPKFEESMVCFFGSKLCLNDKYISISTSTCLTFEGSNMNDHLWPVKSRRLLICLPFT